MRIDELRGFMYYEVVSMELDLRFGMLSTYLRDMYYSRF